MALKHPQALCMQATLVNTNISANITSWHREHNVVSAIDMQTVLLREHSSERCRRVYVQKRAASDGRSLIIEALMAGGEGSTGEGQQP